MNICMLTWVFSFKFEVARLNDYGHFKAVATSQSEID